MPVRGFYGGRLKRRYIAEVVTIRYSERRFRLGDLGTPPGGGRTAPTFPASADLAEGTGTRSFSAVTTAAGDHLVVECIGQDGNITAFTPTCAGLTFTKRADNAASTSDVAIEQWTAPDAGGGSRTVQIAITGSGSYRARVTVVRGSDGPGTGLATSLTGQTVSVTRQADNSAIFMAVGDWSTGAVGSPAWTPGGATVASQQGTGATYLFGRWDDSGAAGTASHGISSPSYTTPSIAVLEMLGTAAAGTAFTATVDDTAGLTDAAAVEAAFARTADDGTGMADSAAAASAFAQSTTDNASLTDSATTQAGFTRTIDDPAGLTDSASPVLTGGGLTRTVDDPAGLTDAATTASTFARTQDDTGGLADTAAPVSAFARTQTDTAGLVDSITQNLAGAGTRQVDDTAGLTDAVSYSSTQTRTDTLGLVDTAILTMAAARTASDSLGLADTVTVALTRAVDVSDSAGLTDSASAVVSLGNTHVRVVTDLVGLDSEHQVMQTTIRAFTGVTARPVGTPARTTRPDAGVTSRYPFVPD